MGRMHTVYTPHLRYFIQFIQRHQPEMDDGTLRMSFASLRSAEQLERPEELFLKRVATVIDYGQEEPQLHSTCAYKPVYAVSEKDVSLEIIPGQSEVYKIGGLGSSGNHEFTLYDSEQIDILAWFIQECLIAGGINVTQGSNRITAAEIKMVAQTYHPFGIKFNCRMITDIARRAAESIAINHGRQLRDKAGGFLACLMRKGLDQYEEQYREQGLSVPPQLGRNYCPSVCAETQSSIEADRALTIPRVIPPDPNHRYYLINHQEEIGVYQTAYNYLDFDENTGLKIPKRLILSGEVDDRIRYNANLWLAKAISQADPEITAEIKKANKVLVDADSQTVRIYVWKTYERTKHYLLKDDEFEGVLEIPLGNIPRFPEASQQRRWLYTKKFPCVYCAHRIIEDKVDKVYTAQNFDFDHSRGDDSYAAELLASVYQGEVVLVGN